MALPTFNIGYIFSKPYYFIERFQHMAFDVELFWMHKTNAT